MAKSKSATRDIEEYLIPAKKNEGGFIHRGSGEGNTFGGKTFDPDGITEIIPVYEPEEDKEILEEVADIMEGYVAESGILDKIGKQKQAEARKTNATLRGIINRVIENPKVSEILPKDWHGDPDWKQAIAQKIKGSYPQFNFEQNQIITEIEEMYG